MDLFRSVTVMFLSGSAPSSSLMVSNKVPSISSFTGASSEAIEYSKVIRCLTWAIVKPVRVAIHEVVDIVSEEDVINEW